MWNIVEGPFDDGNGKMWHLICDCGTEALVKDYDFRSGKSTQCRFCASSHPWSELGRKFFDKIPRKVFKKLRSAANNAIRRCNDTSHRQYNNYGGRGIEVKFPDRDSFVEYIATLPGHDDPSMVIDRIDNDGNYEPGNIRFVTQKESSCNRRSTINASNRYFMKHKFVKCFKRLHDKGVSFDNIGKLYCVGGATVRNCVRELEGTR